MKAGSPINTTSDNSLFVWRSVFLVSGAFGAYLSLKYGTWGLMGFTLLNLVLSVAIPAKIVAPIEPYLPADEGIEWSFGVAIFGVPFFLFIIWFFVEPQSVATYLVQLPDLAIITDDLEDLTQYLIDPLNSDISANAKLTIDKETNFLVGLALARLCIYTCIPIIIALGSINLVRIIRDNLSKSPPTRVGSTGKVGLINKNFYTVVLTYAFLIIWMWAVIKITAAPHHFDFTNSYFYLFAMMLIIVFPVFYIVAYQSILRLILKYWRLHG